MWGWEGTPIPSLAASPCAGRSVTHSAQSPPPPRHWGDTAGTQRCPESLCPPSTGERLAHAVSWSAAHHTGAGSRVLSISVYRWFGWSFSTPCAWAPLAPPGLSTRVVPQVPSAPGDAWSHALPGLGTLWWPATRCQGCPCPIASPTHRPTQ